MWLPHWFQQLRPADQIARYRPRILAVSAFVTDRLMLGCLAKEHGWEIQVTNSPRDAFNLVSRRHFELIFCHHHQPGFPWREVIDRLSARSPLSRILLISPMKNQELWHALIQQGGFDVLISPLRDHDVLPLMSAEELFVSYRAR